MNQKKTNVGATMMKVVILHLTTFFMSLFLPSPPPKKKIFFMIFSHVLVIMHLYLIRKEIVDKVTS